MKKSRALLWFGVTSNLLLLGYFKYMDFFIENLNFVLATDWSMLNIVLPLGISFFTFQQIAYLLDSYKAKTERHSFLDYSLFVSFFPQLIAGPIVHWREMMPQFSGMNQHQFNSNNVLIGLNIFILGFLKKVLIADNLAVIANETFSNPASLDMASSWAGAICFMFQIYFDFSAYSEMAIGAALMMNIKLPVNFNSPYKARNINDFWNRWHITLTRWFFQYTFLPLTAFLTKRSSKPTGVSLPILTSVTFTIFLVSGLWHGAEWTFVIWGAMHGAALVLYRLWQASKLSMPPFMARGLTIIFLIFAAVVFRCNDMQSLTHFTTAMMGGYGIMDASNFVSLNFGALIVVMIVPTYAVYFMPNVLEIVGYANIKKTDRAYYVAPLLKLHTRFMRMETNIYISVIYAFVFSLALIGVMTADSPDAFIYFDF